MAVTDSIYFHVRENLSEIHHNSISLNYHNDPNIIGTTAFKLSIISVKYYK